jgi:hypothetical protein
MMEDGIREEETGNGRQKLIVGEIEKVSRSK